MKNLYTVLFFSLFIANCSTTSYISPKEDIENGVGKYLWEGKEVALSVEDSSTIAFYGEREKREITLYVLFKNNSTDLYLDVYPEDVKILGIEPDGNLEELHTYNPQKYIKRLETQQNLALALSAMGKAFEDYDACTSTATAYGTASASDGTTYNYYGTATTTDESAKRAAERESQRELTQQARQAQLYRSSVKNGLLMKTTLFPGSHLAGNIIVKFKSHDEYILRVPVGNEVHEVRFDLVKL